MIRLVRPPCPYPSALTAGNYKHPDNKKALLEASNNKCMYCESKITHIDFGDVEHIKPKSPSKFPELEFEWENLGIACGKCNLAKHDKYFVETPFIDPYLEEPSDHLAAVGTLLLHRGGSERGEVTHREIDLNRNELIEKRLSKLEDIRRAVDACYRTSSAGLREAALRELAVEAHHDKEYSMFIKLFIETLRPQD